MIFNLATGVTVGLGTVAALGLAAGGCAYAAMWPGSRLFGDALIAPKRPGELALTFDDGPNPIWTPRLLDTLAESNIQATFFLVGSYAESQKELVRRIVSEGHFVGNHSWSHPNLALTCNVRVREELQTDQPDTGADQRPIGSLLSTAFWSAPTAGSVRGQRVWNADRAMECDDFRLE